VCRLESCCKVRPFCFCGIFAENALALKTKILVVRFSSIGDIVLTTPILRCIKAQLPGSEVHYITKVAFKGILQPNPYIDKIFTIQHSISEVLPLLKTEKYDYVVDLQNNLRSLALRCKLGKPAGSFNKLNLRKYIYVRFKWNVMPSIHIVDRYFKALSKLGVTNDEKGLDFFIPESANIAYSSISNELAEAYHVLVIGAKHVTKQIPVQLARDLILKSQLPIVLAGGPEDKEKGDAIAEGLTHKVINACGKLSLLQSASLIEHANKVITADTGLMHIAAALHKHIVVIWGNTVPEFGMWPYLPNETQKVFQSEVKNLACRPCSKLGHKKCPQHHFDCMNKQDVGKIVQWLNQS
jgi:ADP-heptose:LPS heptosyltransferase